VIYRYGINYPKDIIFIHIGTWTYSPLMARSSASLSSNHVCNWSFAFINNQTQYLDQKKNLTDMTDKRQAVNC